MRVLSGLKMSKKKSIYAVKDNEYKRFNKTNLIVLDNTTISDIELKILVVINNLFCVTLYQLVRILKKKEEYVQEKIQELKKKQMIGYGNIISGNNEMILRFFFIEKNGEIVLKNNKKELKDFSMRNNNLIQIKKILEWNEILISMKEKKGSNIIEYSNDVLFFSTLQNKFFKVNGGYLKSKDTNHSLLFEIVRNERDLDKKLTKKIKAYIDFCSNFYNTIQSRNDKIPKMILVFEDDEQMLKEFNMLNSNQLCNENLCFTTDLRIKESSCVEFKMDKKNDLCKIDKYYL